MNKKMMIVPTIFVLTVLFSTSASAQANKQTLSQKIAQKFGLKEGDVNEVFKEYQVERNTQRQEQITLKLDQMVKDKKITAEQKTAILAKLNDLWKRHMDNRDALRTMTPQQRKEEREKVRQELQDWANQHKIDLSQFGMHRFWKMGLKMWHP